MKVKPFGLSRDEQRRELDRIRHPFRIVIDRAKNPFNIGTIVRTAHSFLAAEIVLLGTERWYERAAMGMQRYEHVTEIPTVEAFLARARAEGWRLTVFERERATTDLWRAELPEEAVLVFGNEDDGVAPAIVEAAAEVVAIPMYGINHSYPVVVAAGIAMAEWARRRYERGRLVVPRAAAPRAEAPASGDGAPAPGAGAEARECGVSPPDEPGAGSRRRP